jgi:hypothetical protein
MDVEGHIILRIRRHGTGLAGVPESDSKEFTVRNANYDDCQI